MFITQAQSWRVCLLYFILIEWASDADERVDLIEKYILSVILVNLLQEWKLIFK